jgi:hypothetical protein
LSTKCVAEREWKSTSRFFSSTNYRNFRRNFLKKSNGLRSGIKVSNLLEAFAAHIKIASAKAFHVCECKSGFMNYQRKLFHIKGILSKSRDIVMEDAYEVKTILQKQKGYVCFFID